MPQTNRAVESGGNGQGYDGKPYIITGTCPNDAATVVARIWISNSAEGIIDRENCHDISPPRKLAAESWRIDLTNPTVLIYNGQVYFESSILPDDKNPRVSGAQDPAIVSNADRLPNPTATPPVTGYTNSLPPIPKSPQEADISTLPPWLVGRNYTYITASTNAKTEVTSWYYRSGSNSEIYITDNSGVCSSSKAIPYFINTLNTELASRMISHVPGISSTIACDARKGDVLPTDLAGINAVVFFNVDGIDFIAPRISTLSLTSFAVMIDAAHEPSATRVNLQNIIATKILGLYNARSAQASKVYWTTNGDTVLTHRFDQSAGAAITVTGAVKQVNIEVNLLTSPWSLMVNGANIATDLTSSASFGFQ